jgi:peptidoglycan hydrolase-like protein with peptidoglycan-binding domain
MSSHKKPNEFLKMIARMILGWRKMSRRTRIIILGGIITVAVAAAVLIVLVNDGPGSQPVTAEATPEATATPTATPAATLEPVPTTPPEESVDITLQYKDKSANVTLLQNQLMDLGYLDIDEATDYFGPATEYAVKLFQRQYGLEQSGIADYETQVHLFADDAQKYTILTGTEGDDVKALQRQLIDLGYLASGKATGLYGDATTEAVKKFQKANKLSADGKTGEKTLDRIYSPDAIATPERRKAIQEANNIEQMISAAQSKIGKPYVSGAEGPNSFDCSGLVYYCLKAAGSNRGRYNAAGYAKVSAWTTVKWSELRRGDLMFFWSDSKNKIGHVAIYIGNSTIIDASSTNGKVVKRSCNSNWFKTNFKYGKRPWA